jgi:hypothetical protein
VRGLWVDDLEAHEQRGSTTTPSIRGYRKVATSIGVAR